MPVDDFSWNQTGMQFESKSFIPLSVNNKPRGLCVIRASLAAYFLLLPSQINVHKKKAEKSSNKSISQESIPSFAVYNLSGRVELIVPTDRTGTV